MLLTNVLEPRPRFALRRVKKKRNPFVRVRPRELTISPEVFALMVEDYRARRRARPIADGVTLTITVFAHALHINTDVLRQHSKNREHQALRQQALVFARLVSRVVGPPTKLLRIAEAFGCKHTNALYAEKIYGAAMLAELERITK